MFSRQRNASLIPVRLGALLVGARIIKPETLATMLYTAKQTQQKLGHLLISTQSISPDLLNSALELQQLVKDGSISVELGTRALQHSHENNMSLTCALADFGWNNDNTICINDLGALLVLAECCTQCQIDQAAWNSQRNSMPLGRNLVLSGAISPSLLGSSLNALILMRDTKVRQEEVLTALKQCFQQKIQIEQALSLPQPLSDNHVRVGELLSAAGLLTESDAMVAVEKSLLDQTHVGPVLLDMKMVSALTLDATLRLQALVSDGSISRKQAAELLKEIALRQVKLETFLSEMSSLKSRVLQLLVDSGLISNLDISNALAGSAADESDIITALFAHGMLAPDVFRAAIRCIYAIEEGSMSESEAVEHLLMQPNPRIALCATG